MLDSVADTMPLCPQVMEFVPNERGRSPWKQVLTQLGPRPRFGHVTQAGPQQLVRNCPVQERFAPDGVQSRVTWHLETWGRWGT